MLDSTQFNEQNMLDAVNNSYILATDIADYLVSKSVPFRKAHEIVSKMTDYCIENNKYFHQLTIDEFKKYSSDFEIDIFEINPINSVNNRNTVGGTSESQVKKSIVDIKSRIKSIATKYA
jgi:argininosuccinate lyase